MMRGMGERDDDARQVDRERWTICTLPVRQEGGHRVFLQTIHTLALFKQAMKGRGIVKIVAPERTRYVVEVKDGETVTQRIEAGVLYVRIAAKKLILERTETAAPEAPETPPAEASQTDPELRVRETLADQPIPQAAPKRPLTWNQLPEAVRKMLLPEVQVRSALYAHLTQGAAWSAKLLTMVFQGQLEEGKEILAQRDLLSMHFDRSAKDLIAKILRSPAGSATAEAQRQVIIDFCDEIKTSGGPASGWAEALLQEMVEVEREPLPEAGHAVGVSSGKMPSAMRAVELLRGKSPQIKDALAMLDMLAGMQRYRDVAAGNPKEREALGEAAKIIGAATQKGKPSTGDDIKANLVHIRVAIGDHGGGKTKATMQQLQKVRQDAENRSKSKGQEGGGASKKES